MGLKVSSSPPQVRVILDALRLLVRELRISARSAEKIGSVTGAQLFVLECLRRRPLSMSDLAARTATDASSVSVVVKRLFENGLVSRTTSKSDARSTSVALTTKGTAVVRKAPRPSQVRLARGLHKLRPRERSSLAEGLSSLVQEMGLAGRARMFFEEDGPHATRKRSIR